jgi:hypothetical protein
VAEKIRGFNILAVSDAYRLLPFADVLYSCDERWWTVHKGCPDFAGEKWSSHGGAKKNDKISASQKYGLNLVAGQDKEGFSPDPGIIHYGSNSGFQAVNLALLMGARQIVLVGFDMKGSHFFGKHPAPLRNTSNYVNFIAAFKRAAKTLPADVEIINATPGSALTCFKRQTLDDALSSLARCVGAGRIAAPAQSHACEAACC